MKEKSLFLIVGVIFGLIAILHLLRIIFGWGAIIGNFNVPMWFSYIALALSGYLSYSAFRLYKK